MRKSNQQWNMSYRKVLRNNSTKAEIIFWCRVKGKKLGGLKFRRQNGFGKYIVDFYCPAIKLVIELDGLSHGTLEAIEKDIIRDAYLQNLGLTVFHFPNYMVFESFEKIEQEILDHKAYYTMMNGK